MQVKLAHFSIVLINKTCGSRATRSSIKLGRRSKRAQSEQLSVLCCVCSKFSQPGKPAPRLASSHAKYPDIYRRSKPAVAKLRREAAAFGVNGIMEYKADISEARLGSAARRG
ncbi:hypothetical protein ElyMa_005251000 [Elysia marginata]|uniref:Proline dehydrogenase n=1 Tax=Elysia marginata TaxID=1093978 RepID=A0AAV4JXU8_9GAST|nr:hypothetical protein ElyMa_005251000 [Elysia marginata]